MNYKLNKYGAKTKAFFPVKNITEPKMTKSIFLILRMLIETSNFYF